MNVRAVLRPYTTNGYVLITSTLNEFESVVYKYLTIMSGIFFIFTRAMTVLC